MRVHILFSKPVVCTNYTILVQVALYLKNGQSINLNKKLIVQVWTEEDSNGLAGAADLSCCDHGFLSMVRAVPHPQMFPRLHLR